MSRNLLIALGALAVAVLGGVFVAMPMLFGTDDGVDEPVTAEAPEPDDDGGVDLSDREMDDFDVDDEEADGADEPPAETFEVFSARDPFQQLVTEDELAATDASDGGGDARVDPDDDGDTDPDGEADPDGDADGDDDGDDEDDAPSEVRVGGTSIELQDITTDDDGVQRVEITVNGGGYTLAEGERAEDRLEVVEIDPPCATMLLGDDRFIACEGDRIRK